MFAVGVDVSNSRSTVAVLGAKRKVVMKPFEIPHTADGFASCFFLVQCYNLLGHSQFSFRMFVSQLHSTRVR